MQKSFSTLLVVGALGLLGGACSSGSVYEGPAPQYVPVPMGVANGYWVAVDENRNGVYDEGDVDRGGHDRGASLDGAGSCSVSGKAGGSKGGTGGGGGEGGEGVAGIGGGDVDGAGSCPVVKDEDLRSAIHHMEASAVSVIKAKSKLLKLRKGGSTVLA